MKKEVGVSIVGVIVCEEYFEVLYGCEVKVGYWIVRCFLFILLSRVSIWLVCIAEVVSYCFVFFFYRV